MRKMPIGLVLLFILSPITLVFIKINIICMLNQTFQSNSSSLNLIFLIDNFGHLNPIAKLSQIKLKVGRQGRVVYKLMIALGRRTAPKVSGSFTPSLIAASRIGETSALSMWVELLIVQFICHQDTKVNTISLSRGVKDYGDTNICTWYLPWTSDSR